MPELAHQWGGDLQVSPTGDLATVSGTQQGQQRVLRRLLTGAKEYIWALGYGAGLPGRVGDVAHPQSLAGVIRRQMLLEPVVAPTPEPTVTVASGTDDSTVANISYADATTGQTVTLRSVPVS
jgi:hypothetical protein